MTPKQALELRRRVQRYAEEYANAIAYEGDDDEQWTARLNRGADKAKARLDAFIDRLTR